jgi:DNA-binding transcriptional MerR regulator
VSTPVFYTIHELAEAAGVSPRTIRYYTAEGLLPASDTRGKYVLYTEDHLLRLRLVLRLKELHLPLSEIANRMEYLSTAQVQQLLDEDTHHDSTHHDNSAADYIAQVLAGQSARPAPPPARRKPAPRPAPHPATEPEPWRRLKLAPDVELHYREPTSTHERERIARLETVARQIFTQERLAYTEQDASPEHS